MIQAPLIPPPPDIRVAGEIPRIEQWLAPVIPARSERFCDRRVARREGVVGELALAREHFCPGIKEGTFFDRDTCPRSHHSSRLRRTGLDLPLFRRRAGIARAGHHCGYSGADARRVDFCSHAIPLFTELHFSLFSRTVTVPDPWDGQNRPDGAG